ncbi:MAG: hypothetical protein IPL61_34690 [Myxococcales bacterium]|nr:hypothetical protein [Myxococcales bacterium]
MLLTLLGCGRVAPGTSTNARPTYLPSTGGGGGTTSGSQPSDGKVSCNPQQKGKYGGSLCR